MEYGSIPRDVEVDDDDYLLTVKEYVEGVAMRMFTDYDGYGQYVKDGMKFGLVLPSKLRECLDTCRADEGITHILWYNK